LQNRAVIETNVPQDGQSLSRDSLQTGQKCQGASTADSQAGHVRSVVLPQVAQKRAVA
jgi:hypothetical protein